MTPPNYVEMVRAFMKAADQRTPSRPSPGNDKLARFREALIGEEFDELIDAMADGNVEQIADGCADLLYVVFGTALAFGIPIDEVFTEVHCSNMTKAFSDGKFHKDDDGKVIKSPSYEPPDLTSILQRASR